MKISCKIKSMLIIFLLMTVFILLFGISSCSIAALLDNFKVTDSVSIESVKINLDENELRNLEITNQTIEEKIDTADKLKVSSEGIRNPFLPFFMNPDSEDKNQSNMLVAKRIYSESAIFFVEINLNEAVYKLKLDDLFGKIYQVKAINADSVVLLKGDEIITLFINQIYYD